MEFDYSEQEQIAAKLFGNKEFIYCYKEVEVLIPFCENADEKYIISPVMRYTIGTVKGFYISNRGSKKITRDEKACCAIDFGIHVHVCSPRSMSENCIILKVRCYKRDFVAANYDQSELVFTRIKLLEKDIEKYNTGIDK